MKSIAALSRSASFTTGLLVLLTCACNAKLAAVPEGDAGSGIAPPSSSSGAVCTSDEECNDAIEMSALAGMCNADGTCTCIAGYEKVASGKCGVPATTTTTAFPDYVAGTWLIGWADHFSWVRLEGKDHGKARFLSKASNNAGVTPSFNCDGVGEWLQPQRDGKAMPNTVYIRFPRTYNIRTNSSKSCADDRLYTFKTVSSTPSTFVQGAVLEVAFDWPPTDLPLRGFKFPEGTCNAAFTSCADPFPP